MEESVKQIREKVGSGKVLLALSGGVDSSVAAGLLSPPGSLPYGQLSEILPQPAKYNQNDSSSKSSFLPHRQMWIRRLRQGYCRGRLASSLPVFLWTTVCCEKMKAMRLRQYLVQMETLT